MGEQARLRTYRTLAKEWKLGHETLRKFVVGETQQPHPRQRQMYGARFLELHPSGYVREKRVDGRPVALDQLKLLLPPERERANEVLERIFALDERDPGQVPEEAAAVLAWMRKLLNAEFDAEVRFGRRRGGAPEPPADPDGEE